MKTLLLMRHAKSSWENPKLADHERPLSKRGQKDAPFMGEVLLEKELLPQKILASSAVRARETVEGLVKASQYSGEIEYSDTLYLAEPDTYLAALHALPDSIERVLVVGHNPGLVQLLQKLSRQIESVGAGSIAYLILPIQSWGELTNASKGELVELLRPNENQGGKGEDKKKEKKNAKRPKEEKKSEPRKRGKK